MRALLRVLACAALALAPPAAAAERIVDAVYASPVDRYGHYALGRPHEYGALVVTTSGGRRLTLALPDDDVFEDLKPRRVTLAQGEGEELLTIVSHRTSGARLVLIRLAGDRLEVSAESAPIGTPMRWLNPVGVADLDGDARAEIAAVITPHIGGTLKVYRRNGHRLEERAALGGFSNHVYGSPELGLSAPVAIDGRVHLVVPDTTRRALRVVALDGDRLIETRRCALASPITGPVQATGRGRVSAVLRSGPVSIALAGCEITRSP